MPIDPTAATGTQDVLGPRQASSSPDSLGGLDSEAFLNLLVAQMRYQDPMNPADHTAMLQQSAQFTQVEMLQRVADQQQQLLGLSQATMAGDLVGQDVTARVGDGEVSGVVAGVRFSSDGPLLDLGDGEIPLSAVTEVRDPFAVASPDDPVEEPLAPDGEDLATVPDLI